MKRRPARAIYCGRRDQAKHRLLAIDPKAIGARFRTIDPESWIERYEQEQLASMLEQTQGVAVISIEGPLEHHRNWCWQSYDGIQEAFTRAIEHPDCRSIMLEIDSPGGDVSGCFELVKTMRTMSADAGKPIYAFANEAAYSAAYAIACAASEIYMPPSGGVGSIGVIATMLDRTAMLEEAGVRIEVIKSGARKAYGHPDVPITDAAIQAMQARVDELAGLFFDLVSSSRGLKTKAIRGYEAGTFHGDDAVAKKLADGVMSFSDVMSAARSTIESRPKTKTAKQGETAMSRLLALKNKVTTARAALNAARTSATKAAAIEAVNEAVKAFNAELVKARAAGKPEAKTVKKEKYEKVEETDDEEGAEDAEDAEEDAEEAEEDAEEAEDAEDAGDDGDETDDDEEEDDEDAEATASMSLGDLVATVTGTRNRARQRGVLMAMAESHKKVGRLDKQVARLERDSKRAKVESLIAKGERLKKLSPGMREWARETGMKSPNTLSAFIKSAPVIHALEPEAPAGRNPSGGGGGAGGRADLGLTAAEVTIATNMGIPLEAFAKQKAAKQQNGSLRH